MPDRIPRFFLDSEISAGGSCHMASEEFHHFHHVLRLGIGSSLMLFNGRGGAFEGRVAALSKREAVIQVLRECPAEPPAVVQITLAWALCKPKATDWMLQKATELGVTRLLPFISQHSSATHAGDWGRQRDKWRKTTIEAAKQCGQNYLPEITEVASFEQMLERVAGCGLRLLPAPGSAMLLRDVLKATNSRSVCVTIGPEGGLDEQEVRTAKESGFAVVSLGPRILRTETACLAVLSAILYELG